jgi:glycosyltransferase involved in cell wall biosynthesis
VRVRVVAIHELGPRAERLEQAGIPLECAQGDPERLAQALAGAELVHVFRGGYREPLLPAACRRAGVPRLVETNVFGQVDPSPDEALFDCHLFVSKMCALRYRGRTGRLDQPGFHDRHRVSYWPIETGRLRSLAPTRAQAKADLGFDPERAVVGRIGRDDDRKWRRLLIDMLPPLFELAPDAQVLLVGATPAKLRRLARLGLSERVRVLSPSSDEGELARLYAACDVFVSAAEIGESYSVAICEAMALGLPVVTCSTPWVDNGQVEQVDHGLNGFLADHPRVFAEAVAALAKDGELRSRFSREAAAKADRLWEVGALTRQLERLYGSLIESGRAPEDWQPPADEVDRFGEEYERRSRAQFRPLSASERASVRLERLRERSGWALRAARGLDREKLRLAVSMLKARLWATPGRTKP